MCIRYRKNRKKNVTPIPAKSRKSIITQTLMKNVKAEVVTIAAYIQRHCSEIIDIKIHEKWFKIKKNIQEFFDVKEYKI